MAGNNVKITETNIVDAQNLDEKIMMSQQLKYMSKELKQKALAKLQLQIKQKDREMALLNRHKLMLFGNLAQLKSKRQDEDQTVDVDQCTEYRKLNSSYDINSKVGTTKRKGVRAAKSKPKKKVARKTAGGKSTRNAKTKTARKLSKICEIKAEEAQQKTLEQQQTLNEEGQCNLEPNEKQINVEEMVPVKGGEECKRCEKLKNECLQEKPEAIKTMQAAKAAVALQEAEAARKSVEARAQEVARAHKCAQAVRAALQQQAAKATQLANAAREAEEAMKVQTLRLECATRAILQAEQALTSEQCRAKKLTQKAKSSLRLAAEAGIPIVRSSELHKFPGFEQFENDETKGSFCVCLSDYKQNTCSGSNSQPMHMSKGCNNSHMSASDGYERLRQHLLENPADPRKVGISVSQQELLLMKAFQTNKDCGNKRTTKSKPMHGECRPQPQQTGCSTRQTAPTNANKCKPPHKPQHCNENNQPRRNQNGVACQTTNTIAEPPPQICGKCQRDMETASFRDEYPCSVSRKPQYCNICQRNLKQMDYQEKHRCDNYQPRRRIKSSEQYEDVPESFCQCCRCAEKQNLGRSCDRDMIEKKRGGKRHCKCYSGEARHTRGKRESACTKNQRPLPRTSSKSEIPQTKLLYQRGNESHSDSEHSESASESESDCKYRQQRKQKRKCRCDYKNQRKTDMACTSDKESSSEGLFDHIYGPKKREQISDNRNRSSYNKESDLLPSDDSSHYIRYPSEHNTSYQDRQSFLSRRSTQRLSQYKVGETLSDDVIKHKHGSSHEITDGKRSKDNLGEIHAKAKGGMQYSGKYYTDGQDLQMVRSDSQQSMQSSTERVDSSMLPCSKKRERSKTNRLPSEYEDSCDDNTCPFRRPQKRKESRGHEPCNTNSHCSLSEKTSLQNCNQQKKAYNDESPCRNRQLSSVTRNHIDSCECEEYSSGHSECLSSANCYFCNSYTSSCYTSELEELTHSANNYRYIEDKTTRGASQEQNTKYSNQCIKKGCISDSESRRRSTKYNEEIKPASWCFYDYHPAYGYQGREECNAVEQQIYQRKEEGDAAEQQICQNATTEKSKDEPCAITCKVTQRRNFKMPTFPTPKTPYLRVKRVVKRCKIVRPPAHPCARNIPTFFMDNPVCCNLCCNPCGLNCSMC